MIDDYLSEYSPDNPILSKSSDIFNREQFVTFISDAILLMDKGDTFTIGLCGKWGSGKTSIINMIEEYIKDYQRSTEIDTLIVVRFNPWQFIDEKELITQFFDTLVEHIPSENNKLIKLFQEYKLQFIISFLEAGALIDVKEVSVIKALIIFLRLIFQIKKSKRSKKSVSIEQQKRKIIDELQKFQKKFLIIIDDIDRLNSKQISCVFQLVASIANFPNITYLVAFDKDIVIKALEDVQKGNGNDYLQKCIQLQINVPELSKKEINELLRKKLDDFPNNYMEGYIDDRYKTIIRHFITPLIHTQRDINQLANAIQFKLAIARGEVDYTDLIAITALDLFAPESINLIKAHKSILVVSDSQKTNTLIYHKQIENLNQFSDELKKLPKVNDNESYYLSFVSYLFPALNTNIQEIDNVEELLINKRIGHIDNFDHYFTFNLNSAK